MFTCARRLASLCLVLAGALPLATAPVSPGAAQTAGPPVEAATAQTVADFYRGQTITIVVPFTADTDWTAIAGLLGRYLGRYLPGEPDVIVENMPGGVLPAANYLYNEALPDGLTIGAFDNNSLLSQLVAEAGVQFDGGHFGWLGSFSNESMVVCALRTDSPYTTVDALMREDLPPVVVGATAGGRRELIPKVLNAMLGMNFRVVNYRGSAGVRLAVESGEADGFCTSYSTFLLEADSLVDTSFVRVPIYTSEERNRTLEERYPEATHAEDLIDDPEARKLLAALTAVGSIGRFFGAPPDVPPERLRALQDAFWAAMQDEGLQREAAQAGFEFFEPRPAARVIEVVKDFLDMPVDLVEQLGDIRAN